jgi:hypothetical protein
MYEYQSAEEAMSKGKLKVTGKVLKVDGEYLVMERLNCNVQDCGELVEKEFRLRQTFYAPRETGDMFVAFISGVSKADTVFTSDLKPSFEYSDVFLHDSFDPRPSNYVLEYLEGYPIAIYSLAVTVVYIILAVAAKYLFDRPKKLHLSFLQNL